MSAYAPPMSIQKLFAVLIAVAMLFAPALSSATEAFAAVPDHHAQMMTKGHCEAAPDGSQDQDKSTDHGCCVQLCMAVASQPATPPAHQPIPSAKGVSSLENFMLGTPAEIATPPPRAP